MRYLIITYYAKANGKHDEITELKNSISNNKIQTATVILDLKDKKIIKNSVSPGSDFETMLEMYKRLLGDQLTPYIS